MITHCASASVSRTVFDWAHTYVFYIVEDWFGMNDLDLQSPMVPSGVVSNSRNFNIWTIFVILKSGVVLSY